MRKSNTLLPDRKKAEQILSWKFTFLLASTKTMYLQNVFCIELKYKNSLNCRTTKIRGQQYFSCNQIPIFMGI